MRWIPKLPADPLETLLARLGLDGIPLGLAEALIRVALLMVPVAFTASLIPPASPALLEQTTQVGIVLLLAYVLEAVWLVPRFSARDDYEVRLGAITGIGIAGMIGVALSLLLAAHRAAGHDNWLDWIALGWIFPSLALLAALVVVQPLLVHEWDRPHLDEKSPDAG